MLVSRSTTDALVPCTHTHMKVLGALLLALLLWLLYRNCKKRDILLQKEQFGAFKMLGSGNFGTTYTATFKRGRLQKAITAVIKVPKEGKGDIQEMMACLRIDPHPNIS